MKTIKQFDRATAKAIGEELEEAARKVAAKHGLECRYRGGTFAADAFTAKIEFGVGSFDDIRAKKDEDEFRSFASVYGLEADDFGKEITYAGRKFTLCGLATRSVKMPILAKHGGKTYKLPSLGVLKALGREPKVLPIQQMWENRK